MSTNTSLRSPRTSRHARVHRDDFERISLRNPRSAVVNTSPNDNQSLFNISICSFYFVPSTPFGLRSPTFEHSHKEYTQGEQAGVRALDKTPDPFLFPATNAEKLCVGANHPEIFSDEAFLELLYSSSCNASESANVCSNVPVQGEKHKQLPRKKVPENGGLLGQSQRPIVPGKHPLAALASISLPPCIVKKHEVRGVLPHQARCMYQNGDQSVHQTNSTGEVYEMGDPRSPLQRALLAARAAGYANHERVETGLEAQLVSMQFTKLTATSYEKVSLTHEWFRNCCEYARSIDIAFPSAVNGWLWEVAVQQQCNELYYFYIHDHRSYGTPLPPRLDLRPLQTCARIIRFEQYLVPRHEWNAEDEDSEEEDLVLIRGPYESVASPLRKQLYLGQYKHVTDPHQHLLFRTPPANLKGVLERWRTRNLTEDGTLFRYSRRDAGPSFVEYDDIDHVALFQSSRCRRYFPRLRPNLYPIHR